MAIEEVLLGFRNVKKVGDGRWMALCPAHNDGRASLSIRTMPDGWTTLKCWTGCERQAILEAAGLDWTVLAPERGGGDDSRRGLQGREFQAREALRISGTDLHVILQLLNAAQGGEPLEAMWIERIPRLKASLTLLLRNA